MQRIFLDHILGKRPGAVGMRIVRAPHNMAIAEEIDQMETDEIGLIGRPDLTLEDLTGHVLKRDLGGLAALELALVAIVHFLDDEGYPADRRFGETKLQLGMTLERAEVEHVDERIEKRCGAIAQPHVEGALAFA